MKLAGLLAFAGATLSLTNIIITEWNSAPNFALAIVANVIFALVVAFTSLYIFRRSEQPRLRDTTAYQGPERSSWSSSLNIRTYHLGDWRRCEVVDNLIQALLYLTVFAYVVEKNSQGLDLTNTHSIFVTEFVLPAPIDWLRASSIMYYIGSPGGSPLCLTLHPFSVSTLPPKVFSCYSLVSPRRFLSAKSSGKRTRTAQMFFKYD